MIRDVAQEDTHDAHGTREQLLNSVAELIELQHMGWL
jgi:hypothetical protein